MFGCQSVVEQLMYYLVEVSSLRVYLLPGLDPQSVRTIKDMRPSPSYYLVLASAAATDAIIRMVSGKHVMYVPEDRSPNNTL